MTYPSTSLMDIFCPGVLLPAEKGTEFLFKNEPPDRMRMKWININKNPLLSDLKSVHKVQTPFLFSPWAYLVTSVRSA